MSDVEPGGLIWLLAYNMRRGRQQDRRLTSEVHIALGYQDPETFPGKKLFPGVSKSVVSGCSGWAEPSLVSDRWAERQQKGMVGT